MKKKITVLTMAALVLVSGGCNAMAKIESQAQNQTGTRETLVAYFSCTGTTETIAGYIASETGGKPYKIAPVTPYTSADLNYSDNNSRANREQNNASARPAIKNNTENMENYDVIFLGYPIWWGQAPKIMYTFLESCDFMVSGTMFPLGMLIFGPISDTGTMDFIFIGTGIVLALLSIPFASSKALREADT